MLSYSRRDEDTVKALVQGFDAAKRDVWFDHNLGGGDAWWDSILEHIRSADVFLFALSDASLHSKPCRLELDYALALSRPILPVQVGPVTSFRANPLAALQIITYNPDSAQSGFAILAAVEAAAQRVQPLPDPLPPPPAIPFGYLLALGRQIDSTELAVADQAAVVDQLRRALSDETDESVRQDVLSMLRNLDSKPWVTRRTEREIAALLYAHSPGRISADSGSGLILPAGAPGSAGAAGATGTAGTAASAGIAGATEGSATKATPGSAGTAGATGTSGTSGATGTAGTAGTAGGTGTAATAGSADTAGSVGTPGTSGPPEPEPDPREWFAERLELLQRQRAALERAADPDPPPWRLPPDAAAQWSRTFGQDAGPGAAGGAFSLGAMGPTPPGPAAARPTTDRPNATGPPNAPPGTGQQPAGPPGAGQPAGRPPPAAASGVPPGGTALSAPPHYWATSIAAVVLSLPLAGLFGWVAMHSSYRVGQRIGAGDLAGARRASSRAKAWGIFGIVAGGLLWVILLSRR